MKYASVDLIMVSKGIWNCKHKIILFGDDLALVIQDIRGRQVGRSVIECPSIQNLKI